MSLLPMFHLLMHQIIFHIGLGVLPNVFLCDLFPTKLKGIVGAIVVIFDGIIGFTASKLTQVITDNIGVFWNYAFFWISCLIALVMMFVWVPETGGKTYREIEELLLGENFNSLNEEISTNEMDTRRI
ncbi:facilitated trehalose transporter Tret1-like [Bombus impatiens]|uniref:Facilitated trehalose transporter Tret1-like n=1 Tax=Bombus impatiens TaxID=132113 RepID=A0A6P8L8E6_BOMIM|nr:facilitated trehalose transporter Tret1-like [Bombus impatiens]